MELKVIHRRRRTGFEETKDFPIRVDDLIAGRYQVRLLSKSCKCEEPLPVHSTRAIFLGPTAAVLRVCFAQLHL